MRKENWPKLFADFLYSKKDEAFEWGRNDCILFGAQAVECITGKNFYNYYLGYDSEDSANEIIERNGGIEKLISKHLGESHSNKLQARRGDLVLMKLPRKTIGVVDDSGEKVACLSENGLCRLPMKKIIRVWRVD